MSLSDSGPWNVTEAALAAQLAVLNADFRPAGVAFRAASPTTWHDSAPWAQDCWGNRLAIAAAVARDPSTALNIVLCEASPKLGFTFNMPYETGAPGRGLQLAAGSFNPCSLLRPMRAQCCGRKAVACQPAPFAPASCLDPSAAPAHPCTVPRAGFRQNMQEQAVFVSYKTLPGGPLRRFNRGKTLVHEVGASSGL